MEWFSYMHYGIILDLCCNNVFFRLCDSLWPQNKIVLSSIISRTAPRQTLRRNFQNTCFEDIYCLLTLNVTHDCQLLYCTIVYTVCMYIYFISKSVNILYNTTQNYILYNITQDETHPAHMRLLACCGGLYLNCSF